MAKTPSACGKALLFRHASWLVGVLLVWAVLPLHSKIDFLGRPDRPSDHFASTRTSLQPTERIAIIAIDDQRHSPASARLFPGDSMAKLAPKTGDAPGKSLMDADIKLQASVHP